MNERINELALQAMTYVTHNPKANKLNSGDMFDEKFAELIVKECIHVGLEAETYTEKNWFDAIEKHFGVEE